MWTLDKVLRSPQMNRVANLPYEVSVILYVTPERIRALKTYDKVGTEKAVEVPDINDVIKGCKKNRTNKVILVHNHPPINGVSDASPSEDDMIATTKFESELRKLGVILLDHIIVSPKNYFSFKANDLI